MNFELLLLLQVVALSLQITEVKKKSEEDAENIGQLEESRKKLLKVIISQY